MIILARESLRPVDAELLQRAELSGLHWAIVIGSSIELLSASTVLTLTAKEWCNYPNEKLYRYDKYHNVWVEEPQP